jgi:hypothetical protein
LILLGFARGGFRKVLRASSERLPHCNAGETGIHIERYVVLNAICYNFVTTKIPPK